MQIKSLLLLFQRQKCIVSSKIKSVPSCTIFVLYCKSLGSIKNQILKSKVVDNVRLVYLLQKNIYIIFFFSVGLVCELLFLPFKEKNVIQNYRYCISIYMQMELLRDDIEVISNKVTLKWHQLS